MGGADLLEGSPRGLELLPHLSNVGGTISLTGPLEAIHENGNAGPPAKPPVEIISDLREGPDAEGKYSFNFESGDGTIRKEQGAPQGESGAVATQGEWSFTFPDGTPGQFSFVADGEGFKVQSDLLPQAPPLPPHAVAQIEAARLEDEAAAAAAAAAPSPVYGAP
nr:cuticle protein AM1199-like [Cherax quadricarinatus]